MIKRIECIAFIFRVRKHLKQYWVVFPLCIQEVINTIQILFLRFGAHILKAEILCIMPHQIMRLFTIVTVCRHVRICRLTKPCSRMIIIAELRTSTIVYDHQTDVVAYVTVSQCIHIIEECKVTNYTDKQFVRRCQRRAK